MGGSVSGPAAEITPLALFIVLGGCCLGLIWLFAEAPAGRSLAPPRQKNWARSGRRLARLLLHRLFQLIAVVSLALLAGSALTLLVNWATGKWWMK